MSIWIVLLLGGAITFAMRFSFIYLFGRTEIPDSLRRALRYVPPAVLSAIVFPELLMHSGRLDVSLGNDRVLAGAFAVLVALVTRNMLATIAAGMAALILIQLVM
jgi:branched-subunit amino acid transport protein